MQFENRKASRIKHSYQSIKGLNSFGIVLLIFEVAMILLYAVFVRFNTIPQVDLLEHEKLNALLSTNLMALLGFGFFMGFMQNYILSPLAIVLLILCMSYQFYILFYGWWQRVFLGFSSFPTAINVDLPLLIRAGRCALACIVSVGAISGRIAPKEILKILPLLVIGYTLNQAVIELKINAYDAGGTMLIHAYGGTSSLIISFILSSKIMPNQTPTENYRSAVLSLLGTFFLWLCWPVFNSALLAHNTFERDLIVANTIYSLAGSCISSLIVASLLKESLSFMLLQRATLAGGVFIGCSSQIIYYPGLSLALGAIAGVASCLSLRYLQGRCQVSWGLLDTCGVMSFSVLPSMLGGITSAMVLIGYYYQGISSEILNASSPKGIFALNGIELNSKGGYQAGALFLSLGMGGLFGFLSGFFVSIFYKQDKEKFYGDQWHYDSSLFDEQNNEEVQYNLTQIDKENAPSQERFQRQKTDQVDPRSAESKPPKKQLFKTRYAV